MYRSFATPPGMRFKRTSSIGALRSIELVCVALVLGYAVPHISERWLPGLGSELGRDQLIAFLEAVSTGMMAFTGIVFSLLLVLLQFGTVAYTPRIVSSWVEDRTIANALSVFTGTFFYSLMALRAVGLFQGSRSCALTMYVAFVWLLASLWMLARLLGVFTSLTHANVLWMLGQRARDAIDRAYPEPLSTGSGADTKAASPTWPRENPTQTVTYVGPPLYLVKLDASRLVGLARRWNAVIRIPFAPGDSISPGATLALVYGSREPIPAESLIDSMTLGRERLLEEDPKYAVRVLVDVAVHSLSSGDPTTTVQALDQIEALLTKLGNVELEVGRVRDEGGEVRLVYDTPTWEEYLDLALVEIQHDGASSVQTDRRLAELFAFVRDHVHASRRAAVDRMARQQLAAVADAFRGPCRRIAERRDRQGLGHTLG